MDPLAERAAPRSVRGDRAQVLGDGVAWTARWSLRLIVIAAGAVVLGALIGQLWSVVLPVVLGLVVATVLAPPARWLRGHRVPATLAAALVLLAGLGVLTGVVLIIVPSVVGQAPQIAQGAVGGIQQIQAWLRGPPLRLGAGQIGGYIQLATDRLAQSATDIAGGVITGISAVASGVITGVLALVLAFLFVKDGPAWLPWVRRVAGPRAGRHLEAVMRRSWARVGGFIRTQAIIGLVDAGLIGTGLVIFGVPLALPLAVLTFFGAFVPIIGALVAGTLSVLIALVVKGPGIALGVAILILVVQQLEGNLLQPVLQGRGLGLHAAVVILAVTGGSSLFGIAGAFLAVPLAAVVAEVLRYLSEQVDTRLGAAPEAGTGGDAGTADAGTADPEPADPDRAGGEPRGGQVRSAGTADTTATPPSTT